MIRLGLAHNLGRHFFASICPLISPATVSAAFLTASSTGAVNNPRESLIFLLRPFNVLHRLAEIAQGDQSVIIERLKAYTGQVRELARLADVSPGTIIGLRDGVNLNPTIRTIRKIEAALDQVEGRESAASQTDTEKAGKLASSMGMDQVTIEKWSGGKK